MHIYCPRAHQAMNMERSLTFTTVDGVAQSEEGDDMETVRILIDRVRILIDRVRSFIDVDLQVMLARARAGEGPHDGVPPRPTRQSPGWRSVSSTPRWRQSATATEVVPSAWMILWMAWRSPSCRAPAATSSTPAASRVGWGEVTRAPYAATLCRSKAREKGTHEKTIESCESTY